MKNKIKLIVINIIISLFICTLTGCNNNIEKIEEIKNNNIIEEDNITEVNNVDIIGYNTEGEVDMVLELKITINNKTYTAKLEDNETVREFIEMLPQEFNMNELNSNEKFVYLNNPLPTNSYSPKHINAGDIMLYGNNCLVIFYKSFDTSYSYTKIGHIENLPDLGTDNITIRFEK